MIEDMSFIDPKTMTNIIAAIRKSFIQSMEYTVVKHKHLVDERGPRGGRRYYCNMCKLNFGESEIKIDHIEPVVPLHLVAREMTLKQYYNRCFCKVENLQVLCSKCHDKKSADEGQKRKQFKKLKKVKEKV